jgi:hypothetical protein
MFKGSGERNWSFFTHARITAAPRNWQVVEQMSVLPKNGINVRHRKHQPHMDNIGKDSLLLLLP